MNTDHEATVPSSILRCCFLFAAIGAIACASAQTQPPLAVTQPCNTHVCRVTVFNHQAGALTIVWKDSAGRSENMGRVAGASGLGMNITMVRFAGFRVFAIDGQKNIFATDYTFPLSGPMDIHFPDDFVAVEDTIMPIRKPN